MDVLRRQLAPASRGESQSLLQSEGPSHFGSLCGALVLVSLAFIWCVVDQWNHTMSDALFDIGNLQTKREDGTTSFPDYSYPLSLAFCQFLFMGLFFLALYCMIFQDASSNWTQVYKRVSSDRRWPALVVTHIFSIFWLQALMMPAQALTLGLFAASRAIEIPAAAILRAPIVGAPFSWKSAKTIFLASSAAAVLFYAYVQVSGCLCVWSGHGVSLLGASFWIVYILVLTLPAANVVLQEGVMQEPHMHPVLMLGLQNLLACILFFPVLTVAHFAEWEDVRAAFSMVFAYREVYMIVTWLCIQMALISAVSVGVICLTNSFWATTLRALRVVYWWLQQLCRFYIGTAIMGKSIAVSIACPHSSKWSFVMLCGFVLAAATIYTDRKGDAKLKKYSLPPIIDVPKMPRAMEKDEEFHC